MLTLYCCRQRVIGCFIFLGPGSISVTKFHEYVFSPVSASFMLKDVSQLIWLSKSRWPRISGLLCLVSCFLRYYAFMVMPVYDFSLRLPPYMDHLSHNYTYLSEFFFVFGFIVFFSSRLSYRL
jgi:hypothetical protein